MIEIDVELIKRMVEREKRIDNRKFDEYRNITIETNVISQAEGSARVRLGDTEIIAGVKMDVGTPYPDTPDEGVMSVNAELVPLANPEFESGPPRRQSIELARVVDRAIRESKMIDTGKLCIKEKKYVWMVFVDIDVLNDDGNLIDAACLAAVAALLNTKMPELIQENEDEKPTVNRDKKIDKLPVTGIPVTNTFVKIGNHILVDSNFAEFSALDARLSVGTLKGKFCSMQKGGTHGFTLGEIEKIIDLAEQKGEELRKLIEEIIVK